MLTFSTQQNPSEPSPPAAVSYAYDPYGHFASVGASVPASPNTPQNNLAFNYSYLPGTRLVSGYTSSSGYSFTREYEPYRNLISTVENGFGSSVISSFAYVNDALGRRTTRNNGEFAYNDRNEVIAAIVGNDDFLYDYDAIGNRISSAHDAHVQEYIINELNQYTQISASSAPPRAPTYDADGNMTFDGTEWHYIWNGENRLICAYNTTNAVDYAYDHAGRMIHKTTISLHNTAPHKPIAYTWDGFNIIAETSATSSGVDTTHNIWGVDIDGLLQGAGGIGGLLAVVAPTNTFFPAYDANGNVTEYTDAFGAVVASREYDPFGGAISASGDTGALIHWFSTKPFCSATGLYEYQFRMYNPAAGRWLNRDLISEIGGLNLYVFCKNNSMRPADSLEKGGIASNSVETAETKQKKHPFSAHY